MYIYYQSWWMTDDLHGEERKKKETCYLPTPSGSIARLLLTRTDIPLSPAVGGKWRSGHMSAVFFSPCAGRWLSFIMTDEEYTWGGGIFYLFIDLVNKGTKSVFAFLFTTDCLTPDKVPEPSLPILKAVAWYRLKGSMGMLVPPFFHAQIMDFWGGPHVFLKYLLLFTFGGILHWQQGWVAVIRTPMGAGALETNAKVDVVRLPPFRSI